MKGVKTRHHLYYEMLRIRAVEEEIANRYGNEKMRCPVHLSIGQEAVAVGVSCVLEQQDYVISNHRAHAHYLAKGGSLPQMIAEIYGKIEGCSRGRGGSMHLVDLNVGFLGSTPIVGGSIPIGVGAAFATQMKGAQNVTVIYFGEGATEEGVFAESLNFAALKNLSILFICENNFYSVYSPLSVRQAPLRDRKALAEAHGIYSLTAFGNDVDHVKYHAEIALKHVKEGKGPAFLEYTTYRYLEHCGPHPDRQLSYRKEEEVEEWMKKDPLTVYIKKHSVEDDLLQEFQEEIKKEIQDAFEFAERAPL